jgi:LysR family glycine cleavage system transcriptional activator
MQRGLPPLQWLRSFESAARHLSFTQAANELHITQSAVSQQVKSLESHLNQPLFIRRHRGLSLTESGEAYLPSVQSAFEVLGNGTRQLRGDDSQGTLEIRANLAFTSLWLLPRIDEFLNANPWVQLSLSTGLWSSDFLPPHSGVEIRYGRGDWEGVVGERLLNPVCFPVSAPAMAARLSHVDDLRRETLIHGVGLLDDWGAWLESAGAGFKIDARGHRTTSLSSRLELVLNGFGVAIAHGFLVEDLLAANRLAKPFAYGHRMRESYYLIAPRDESLTDAARAFKAWLLSKFPRPADLS